MRKHTYIAIFPSLSKRGWTVAKCGYEIEGQYLTSFRSLKWGKTMRPRQRAEEFAEFIAKHEGLSFYVAADEIRDLHDLAMRVAKKNGVLGLWSAEA